MNASPSENAPDDVEDRERECVCVINVRICMFISLFFTLFLSLGVSRFLALSYENIYIHAV